MLRSSLCPWYELKGAAPAKCAGFTPCGVNAMVNLLSWGCATGGKVVSCQGCETWAFPLAVAFTILARIAFFVEGSW